MDIQISSEEFKRRMAELPEPPDNSEPPFWDYWRHDLWLRGKTEGPAGFMGWPSIYHTMLVNHWPTQISAEFRSLQLDFQRWRNAVTMPAVCDPPDYHAGTVYSRNLIHQAYHVKQWEMSTGKSIDNCRAIIEFGGGYGAMALLLARMARRKYKIYDLDEFRLLQDWFLGTEGITLRYNDLLWTDLFIACYSLSETDFEWRDMVLLENPADSYLLLYSNVFAEYDNISYFQDTVPIVTGKQICP